jgi:hypothetical protein
VTAIATGFGARQARRRRPDTPAEERELDRDREQEERHPFKAPSVTDVEIDIPSFLKED